MKTNYQFEDIEIKDVILPHPSIRSPWNLTSNEFGIPWISGMNGSLNHLISSLCYFSFFVSPKYEYSRFKFHPLNSPFKIFSLVLGFTANIIAPSLSMSVDTATLCTTTSVLLLLGVLQCCGQQCSRRTSPHSLLNCDARNQSQVWYKS